MASPEYVAQVIANVEWSRSYLERKDVEPARAAWLAVQAQRKADALLYAEHLGVKVFKSWPIYRIADAVAESVR